MLTIISMSWRRARAGRGQRVDAFLTGFASVGDLFGVLLEQKEQPVAKPRPDVEALRADQEVIGRDFARVIGGLDTELAHHR